jgi:hypothetical protein
VKVLTVTLLLWTKSSLCSTSQLLNPRFQLGVV